MQKSILLFSFSLITFCAYAQFSAGIKTGVNFSNIDMNGIASGLENMTDPLSSAMFGVFGEYDLHPDVAVRWGANYTRRGTIFQQSTHVNVFDLPIPVGIRTKLNIKYIDLPATIQYSKKIGAIEAYGKIGGGLSKAISATLEPQVTALFDFNLPKVDISLDSFNDTEFFALAGFGASYPTKTGKLFVEAEYQHALETLKPDFLVDLDLKNKGFSVGIGYAMPF